MKLPKRLFVHWDMGQQKGDECLLAFEEQSDAVEDDGPTDIGVYELKETRTVGKAVVIGKTKKVTK